MTSRTAVKSIEGNSDRPTAFVVSNEMGVINRIPKISKVLEIGKLPAVRVGDILKCDGNPYLSKLGATASNPRRVLGWQNVLDYGRFYKPTHKAVQIGEEAWALREIA